jgi:hypothetical protein
MQHGWPAVPHDSHVVPEQTVDPPEHVSPANTHICVVGSQQPPVHAVPVVQHAAPL